MSWLSRYMRDAVSPRRRGQHLHVSAGVFTTSSPSSYLLYLAILGLAGLVRVATAVLLVPIAWLVHRATMRRSSNCRCRARPRRLN